MKPLSLLVFFGGILAAAAAGSVFFTLQSFNQFTKFENAFGGVCASVAGIAGPEDIQIDPLTRRAFISSFDRQADPKSAPRGGVFVFSIDDPLADDAWRDRTKGVPAAFEPLGLHFYDDGETRRLFVVNAATKAIEMYDVAENGDLVHMQSFKERRLTSPNDVVAVGPTSFYVTNDAEPGSDSVIAKAHFLLRIGSGRVLYFNGSSWRVAAEGLRYANGVAASRDGARLYVAETAGEALRIYAREPQSGALDPVKTVEMKAGVDNINIDRLGVLWIGAHPKPLLLPAYLRNPKMKAPSLVIRYDDIEGGASKPFDIYVNDGAELSASTVAARLGPTLLIGALLEKKFLICNLPA
ncbi:MAG: SMP-30/gluconolactonase/LRE family protein [Amphiplicatus sp.]